MIWRDGTSLDIYRTKDQLPDQRLIKGSSTLLNRGWACIHLHLVEQDQRQWIITHTTIIPRTPNPGLLNNSPSNSQLCRNAGPGSVMDF